MTTIPDLVDVEAILVAHAAADVDLDALVDGAVSTELPADFPAEGDERVQLFRVSSTDQANGYIERAVVQVNAYGSTRALAFDVARAALRALRRAEGVAFADGIVTAVDRLTGPSWSPDPITSAPRFTLSLAVTVHPPRP